MSPLSESTIESFALETLQSLGWSYLPGIAIAPGAQESERESYEQIILTGRLRKAVATLNPAIPEEAQEQAVQKVLRIYSPDLLHNNKTFHNLLTECVKIPYQQDGFERSHEVALIDFEEVRNNEFLAVNQYTISENGQNKLPDVLLFVNGLPLVVMELKNATREHATLISAWHQIQTYKAAIPSLFTYNAVCVISDGHEAKGGSLTAGFSRYAAWKTEDGSREASRFRPQLETLLRGMLNPATLLDLVQGFLVFEETKREDPWTGLTQVYTEKKLAAYHQYYAVKRAVASTIHAAGITPSPLERACPDLSGAGEGLGNKKGGVVWHTQGSGKSLSMVFYAGQLITAPEMRNPTLLVITDRNDLDDQLYDTFAACRSLLRQEPVQARDRAHLKELLRVASGGIVFTTIQKIFA